MLPENSFYPKELFLLFGLGELAASTHLGFEGLTLRESFLVWSVSTLFLTLTGTLELNACILQLLIVGFLCVLCQLGNVVSLTFFELGELNLGKGVGVVGQSPGA